MEFPCCQCGACCKATASFSDDILSSAGLTRGPSGWCDKLQSDNRCSIYADRPELCRVGAMVKGWGLPRNVVYHLSAQNCDKLMAQQGMELAGIMTKRVEELIRLDGSLAHV